MSKVNCFCGSQISDVQDPCKDKSFLISDIDFDPYTDKDWIDPMDLMAACDEVWHCRQCGRVAIESNKTKKLSWYKLEKSYD